MITTEFLDIHDSVSEYLTERDKSRSEVGVSKMNYDEHIKMIMDLMYNGYLTFDETVNELYELIMGKITEEMYEKFVEAGVI